MRKVVIIGAGPCGLFTALELLKNPDIKVELYDKQRSAGNKLLIAGKSGLNLTHSETIETLSQKYYEHSEVFLKWLNEFSNQDLIQWANQIGVETFIGSSGRVFPLQFKAAQMLKIWMDSLKKSENFGFFPNSTLNFIDPAKKTVLVNDEEIEFDELVLALGGGSWSKTGSDGMWIETLKKINIRVQDFYSLNCGFNTKWSQSFSNRFEIMPVKYINVRHGETQIKGDIMLTPWGVEGTPIYSLSHSIQKEILENGTDHLEIYIDLKPDLNLEQISEKLKGKKSISTKLKALLSGQAILLLRELTSKEDYLDEKIIASKIKNLKLKLTGPRPIEEAISTGGGVYMNEVTNSLSLKNYSNIFVGGEMLSWGAPTGGYLLQGCFTQGYIIAKSIRDKAIVIK
jgi:uncharacterized flavoprotein (TIGR03862 family)